MEIIKNYKKVKFKNYINVIIGMLICAISYNLFLLPNNIVFGGLSGLSIILNEYFNIIPAVFIFGTSLFLSFFSLFLLGKELTFKGIIGAAFYSLFVELTTTINDYVVIPNDDYLLIIF